MQSLGIGNEPRYPTQSIPLNKTMMNNTANHTDVHPIEFFIACLFNLADAILWTINEVLGHHVTTSPHQPQTTTTATATTTQPHPTQLQQDPWDAYINTLNVKQLRVHTGIKNKKILKAQLIAIATGTMDQYTANYA